MKEITAEMSLWTAENLKRYSAFCIPVAWSDDLPRTQDIIDVDEDGEPFVVDLPWNIKRDMLLTKKYIAEYADKHDGKTNLKPWFRTLHKYKEYIKRNG